MDFSSIPAFVAHLGGLAVRIEEAERDGLEMAARIVEGEAKGSVGTYQEASGPFAAWQQLTESTQADRVAHGFPADEPEKRTGAMADSIEHVVIGREAHVGSDDEVLLFQELGTSKMPARSILGGAAVRKGEEAAHEVGRDVVAAIAGQTVTALLK